KGEALAWVIRCVALFEEFPHPATGPGPEHLARLTRLLGRDVLDRTWRTVTGTALPHAVVEYLDAHQGDPDGGGQTGEGARRADRPRGGHTTSRRPGRRPRRGCRGCAGSPRPGAAAGAVPRPGVAGFAGGVGRHIGLDHLHGPAFEDPVPV